YCVASPTLAALPRPGRRPGCARTGRTQPSGATKDGVVSSALSEGYEMPSVAQRVAGVTRAQMAEAASKPSLTTVVSMLALVTHTGVSRDAGSVMLAFAGSVVVPFSRAAGTLSLARRMVAMETASWASWYTAL